MSLLRPIVVLALSAVCMGYAATVITAPSSNNRPIIGVLSQELSRSLENEWGELNYTSFIAASYVKFLESAGARVVPIKINREMSYYTDVINSINGLLIPGGANFYNTSGYGLAGEILYNLAIDLNNQGDYFPIWGTCLGFELLIYLMAGKDDPRIVCDAWDKADPLDFEIGFNKSKIFSPAPSSVVDILATEPVTANFHRWCVTKELLTEANIVNDIDILATSVDHEGLRYVAAFESKTYPFFAVQFHPEKPAYEWNIREKNIPHTANSIHVSSYFAEFFVNEARKSTHQFPTLEKERSSLIYNYAPTYTGAANKTYDQCYFFTD
ncbi:gamma-glutamyl hydrolase-like [Neocloeon triangulifer]|uniref:gamma-glutamyl hydrolase-like n=1 Tax=Neocloeon triangulifer TaxID=2078957 RepID=UPI00286EF389|nr:gamma-glutamyl hydrolase-like [Neocloeon triangulifer]